MTAKRVIRVGTRESILARLQTDIVVGKLQNKFPDLEFQITPVTTHGDKVQDRPIAEIGTRGVFVKELEKALYDKAVDFVVHSLKDVPTDSPEGLMLASVLDRADPRDVVVARGVTSGRSPLESLPAGSKLATSSRRRIAQLKSRYPHLEFIDMRGNIQTRLRKLDEGQCDAMILAAAGLIRLGLQERIAEFLPVDLSTPAVGQGALAAQCRSDDREIASMLHDIEDAFVRVQVTAERTLLEQLGGGCSVPIGALATTDEPGMVRLRGCVASLDGQRVLRAEVVGQAGKAEEVGMQLAQKLMDLGAQEILAELRASLPNAISAP